MPHQQALIKYLHSFVQLPDHQVAALSTRCVLKKIGRSEVYFDKHTYSKKLGFLAKGVMRIYDIDDDGRQWNKVFLHPPSFLLGDLNLEQLSTHYVESITPCEILEWPIDFIKDRLTVYPELQEIRTKLLLDLFAKKSKREYELLTLSATERYLNYQAEYQPILADIPQFQVASYLGITTTQLSRINVALRNQQM